MDLLRKAADTIERHELIAPGERVLVAVSGGPDSTCLLYLLEELKEKLGTALYAAHVNHQLRGEESDREEALVREAAEKLGIGLFVTRADPDELRSMKRHSLQSAARQVRRKFFRDAAEECRATKVALGHTADDRAEEVLMRLLRGSGLRGLAGIRPMSEGFWIRPLIEAEKKEILAYLDRHKIPFLVDSSNLREDYLRNRVRLRLLPLLREEYNPRVDETLARSAALFLEDEEFMARAALDASLDILGEEGDKILLDLDGLEGLHPALKRRVVRLAVLRAAKTLRGLNFGHVDAALSLATGGELHLPGGLRVLREYSSLVFFHHPPRRGYEPLDLDLHIPGPGAYPVPALETTLVLSLTEEPEERSFPDELRVSLNPEKVPFPLTLRSPRAGDRVALPGGRGTKKLSDLWTDAKLPRAKRRELILLATKKEIIWAPGLYLDPRFRARPGQRSLMVTLG